MNATVTDLRLKSGCPAFAHLILRRLKGLPSRLKLRLNVGLPIDYIGGGVKEGSIALMASSI